MSDKEAPILDEGVLDRMKQETDPAIVPELITLFLSDARQRATRLRDAVDSGDLDLMHREAHTLGSSAATFGVMRLHFHAREIEAALAAQDRGRTALLVGRLDQTADDAFQALEGYIA